MKPWNTTVSFHVISVWRYDGICYKIETIVYIKTDPEHFQMGHIMIYSLKYEIIVSEIVASSS